MMAIMCSFSLLLYFAIWINIQYNRRFKAPEVLSQFRRKCSTATHFYPINIESKHPQDSSYMGNIAASNAVWVNIFDTKRRKGNTKKPSFNLRMITPVDYNEGSNDDENGNIEEESGITYQYPNKKPTSDSYATNSSTILSGYSSLELSLTFSQKATFKR